MIDKQLFERFLRNECNAAEKKLVSEYLDAHPEILVDYLSEEEFEAIDTTPWEKARSERSFRHIQQRLKGRSFTLLKWSLAAAAAALFAIVGVKWLTPAFKDKQAQARKAVTEGSEWMVIKNNSSNVLTFTLPDSSMAELTPGSRIEYPPSFAGDKQRLVRLEGEGQFLVASNEQRPFTVMSGELATTALGTYFSVIADPGATTIKVHLYNGKVRIGTPGVVKWKDADSVLYLQPGEELTYDKQQMLAVVRGLQKERPGNRVVSTTGKSKNPRQSQQLLPSQKPEWYMFGGQPLTEVFDQLSDYYGVQINYFPSDVANRYFTGKISKNDSLADILKDISLLHGLTLKKVDGMYVFRKKEQ